MAGSPQIVATSFGRITIGRDIYEYDVYILASDEVKKRKKKLAKEVYGTSHKIGPTELKKLCKGHPAKIFIGTGQSGVAELTQEGDDYLRRHEVESCVLPTPDVIGPYNECPNPKAALIHVTC